VLLPPSVSISVNLSVLYAISELGSTVCRISLQTALRSATPEHGLHVIRYAYGCSVNGVSPLTCKA